MASTAEATQPETANIPSGRRKPYIGQEEAIRFLWDSDEGVGF